jgi:hypothetical protein
MRRYQPSKVVRSEDIQLLTLSSVLTGLLVGRIGFAISRVIYIFIFSPILMGAFGGAVIARAIEKGKVRNPTLAITFSALTGLIIYGTLNYGDYFAFRQKASKEIAKEFPQVDQVSTNQLTDRFLREKTGLTGFCGYLKYSAQQGQQITIIGHPSEVIKLNETFTWLYWLVELGLIGSTAIAITRPAASEPFCETCQQWYGDKQWLGSVDCNLADNFLNRLETENLTHAGEIVNGRQIRPRSVPRLDIYLQRCLSCQISDSVIVINKISLASNRKAQSESILTGMLSSKQKADFVKAVERQAQQKDDTEES